MLFSWIASAPLPAAAAPRGDPAAVLLEGLTDCREAIDLSGASLPVSELGQIYLSLLHSRPELFHVAPRLSFSYTEITAEGAALRVVHEVYPAYTLTGEELTAARALYRDTLSAILTEMELTFGESPRTEADSVLYLHDCLADRYAYDTRTDAPNADPYTFFRDGEGICQAYALAFLALCRGAGLEAELVVSEAMDHAWNHVRADGVWYHVDVTRDDPIPSDGGTDQVNHLRLLRSDGGMEALGYYGYTCPAGHTCTDTRFEPGGRAVLEDFHGPLAVFGSHWAGASADGAPVAVKVGEDGMAVGLTGDMDRDGTVTPADLLAVYDPAYPEAWRTWLRGMLVR